MNVVVGLAIVGAVLTIGGLVWRFLAMNKRKQMERKCGTFGWSSASRGGLASFY